MKRTMICIACPMGCNMEIENVQNSESAYTIIGNKCPRGKLYAEKEMTNPTRMLTTTVKITGAHLRCLPVKTSAPIPKNKIFCCMDILNDIRVTAPVKIGDVIVSNILGLGVDIVASRTLE